MLDTKFGAICWLNLLFKKLLFWGILKKDVCLVLWSTECCSEIINQLFGPWW